MRVRGSKAPSNSFTVEAQPNKPGFVLVRFYENVEPFEDTMEDGIAISGYQYDEYHLALENRDGLAEEIMDAYDIYMTAARDAELSYAPTPTIDYLMDILLGVR